ncbi:MAG: Recombination protein RecR [Microgenomates group bacterium ADurb.Bin219]|nr:MAG: Recombination protein RecR [Microgenomates group bacterium ADurb.Bin219]HNP89375.1 recombination mediator RecR [Candidatus Woesebacteria bacterium]
MNLPKPIKNLIDSFERLPGIGPKTAQRLAFYLLHVPQEMLDEFGDSLKNLKKDTVICSICFNVSESDPCPICASQNRDHSVICVVEQALDILALEKTGRFKGVYHVLGGAISPLNNIGPDELSIRQLLDRVREQESERVKEVILATNPNMEGEATAMYITNEIKKLEINELRITRLGQGLPTGGDLEYADEVTLQRAFEGRREC